MARQSHFCAFTHSCVNSGPRFRLGRTRNWFCGPHYKLVQIAPQAGGGEAADQGSRISLAGARRDGTVAISAAAYAGIVRG